MPAQDQRVAVDRSPSAPPSDRAFLSPAITNLQMLSGCLHPGSPALRGWGALWTFPELTVGVGNDKNHSGSCALGHSTRIKSIRVLYAALKTPQQTRSCVEQTILNADSLHLAKSWEADAQPLIRSTPWFLISFAL